MPAAITASFNLALHDAEHARLQAELAEVRPTSPTSRNPRQNPDQTSASPCPQLDADISTLVGEVQATELRRSAEEASLRVTVESLAEVRPCPACALVTKRFC